MASGAVHARADGDARPGRRHLPRERRAAPRPIHRRGRRGSLPDDDNVWSDFQPPEPGQLDLAGAGVSTVLWSSGFRPDYRWLEFGIFDEMGLPQTRRGVSEVPGLFFIGQLWQTNQVSATLFGPWVDAPHVATEMGLTLPPGEVGGDPRG